MAQDMQWPTEDEDFDAKTDAVNTKPFSNQSEKLPVKPGKKPANKVPIAIAEPDSHQSEAADPTASAEIEQAFSQPVQSRDQAEEIDEPQAPAQAEAEAQDNKDDQEPEATHNYDQAPEAAPTKESEETADQHYQPAPAAVSAPKDKNSITRTVLEVVLVIALLAVGVYAFGLQSDKKDLSAKNSALSSKVTTLESNPQIAIQKQTDELITKVGALIQLPKGETPTIANVSDAAKAKQQSSFFDNAQNGDKVLMYVKAGEAILYRPSTNKVVLVAPLTFNAPATPAATKPTR